MVDIFDRILAKFTAGSQKRRTVQVAISASILLVLCVASALYLSTYSVELKARAEGEVANIDQPDCPTIILRVNNQSIENIRPGQEVIIKNNRTDRTYENFRIDEIKPLDTPSSIFFIATATCNAPLPPDHDLKLKTPVKASITYAKKKVMKVLFEKKV